MSFAQDRARKSHFTTFRLLHDGKGAFLAVAILGLITVSFGLGAWFAGAPAPKGLGVPEIVGILGTVATAGAATAAAFSARFTRLGAEATRESAFATRETVEEMREARRDEQRPRLMLERKFLDFAFVCPGGINNGPDFRARTQYDPPVYAAPTFELSNYSSAPAVDVTIEFVLVDDNGAYDLHPGFSPLGIRIHPAPSIEGQAGNMTIMFAQPVGGGTGFSLFHRTTVFQPFCGPGQTRIIEFPVNLLATLFARGLQYTHRRFEANTHHDLTLIANVSCFTTGHERLENTFTFKASMFCYGPTIPLEVRGHFRELPSHTVPDSLSH